MMGNGTSAAEEQAKRLREKLERELGPTIVAALADPAVVEVMLNADGGLWLDVLGEGMRDTGVRMSAMQAENLLRTIAAALEISVNAEQPILEGTLPFDGSRFAGVLPPISNQPGLRHSQARRARFHARRLRPKGNLRRAHG